MSDRNLVYIKCANVSNVRDYTLLELHISYGDSVIELKLRIAVCGIHNLNMEIPSTVPTFYKQLSEFVVNLTDYHHQLYLKEETYP